MYTKDIGDPGAYDPFSGSSVSSQKTFNKTQQTGIGGFGTTSKRAAFSTVSEAPGPGAYDARVLAPHSASSFSFSFRCYLFFFSFLFSFLFLR